MKTVSFSGHSDDIVLVTDHKGADEHGCYQSDDKETVHASFVVGGRIRVRALYDGCWSFAVGQLSEGINFPEWPIRITQKHPYSVQLEVDVPDECSVVVKEETR